MRRSSFRFGFGIFVLSTSALIACVADKTKRDPIPLEEDRTPPTPTGEPTAPEPTDGSPPRTGRVFAHTGDTLYLFEPFAKKVTPVGPFDCLAAAVDGGDPTSMIDIAIDGSGQMFGTTFEGFVTIDSSNASCTLVKKDTQYPNSLSFVPAGTADPSKEALVGYAFDEFDDAVRYVRIDTQTGQMTEIGDLNPASATTTYRSSGDIVALVNDNNRAFLTVRVLPENAASNDLLAEIDPSTGVLKKIVGDTGHKHIYGFGYWAGRGYGFDSEGHLIQIDMTTGVGTTLTTYRTDGGAISWYGAGVTTQAPSQ